VEEIITMLSKLSGVVVIARSSSFACKGISVDVRRVAKDLGVRFVLAASSCGLGSNNWGDLAKFRRPTGGTPVGHGTTAFLKRR
jgi:hypothetical protein